ncbi:MAG: hypothetical protein ACRC2T_09850, partial [Thermoguttaceae bacterium]
MFKEFCEKYRQIYHDTLLNDVVPFWFPNCVDTKYGGFFNAVSRDGTLLHSEKYAWFQGRTLWTIASLCRNETLVSSLSTRTPAEDNSAITKEKLLDWGKQGCDFIEKCCVSPNDKAFLLLTREGKPLERATNWYSDIYQILGLSAFAALTKDVNLAQRTFEYFERVLPELQSPKDFNGTR